MVLDPVIELVAIGLPSNLLIDFSVALDCVLNDKDYLLRVIFFASVFFLHHSVVIVVVC